MNIQDIFYHRCIKDSANQRLRFETAKHNMEFECGTVVDDIRKLEPAPQERSLNKDEDYVYGSSHGRIDARLI